MEKTHLKNISQNGSFPQVGLKTQLCILSLSLHTHLHPPTQASACARGLNAKRKMEEASHETRLEKKRNPPICQVQFFPIFHQPEMRDLYPTEFPPSLTNDFLVLYNVAMEFTRKEI